MSRRRRSTAACAPAPVPIAAATTRLAPLARIIRRFQQRTPIRAHSLIVTLYGDVIEPHGGTIWLGSLIELLAPLGINERLIRTSMFRLGKDGWLAGERSGRRSYYRLTESGQRRFDTAFKRVYSGDLPPWDGAWTLLVLTQLPPEKRKALREELQWQGFAALSPVLLASPRCDRADLLASLQELKAGDECIFFQARAQDLPVTRALHHEVRESWHLDVLGEHYHTFISTFSPLLLALRGQCRVAPEDAFLSRILLIHDYRRLLLRDPQLPDELLPQDWEGHTARQLCRDLYRLVYARAEEWLDDLGVQWSIDGITAPPRTRTGEDFRFGVGGCGETPRTLAAD